MWIFLTIMFLLIFPFIFKKVWLDHAEVYTAKNIFSKAWELIKWAFQLKDVIRESQEQNQYRGQLYYDIDSNTNDYDDYTL